MSWIDNALSIFQGSRNIDDVVDGIRVLPLDDFDGLESIRNTVTSNIGPDSFAIDNLDRLTSIDGTPLAQLSTVYKSGLLNDVFDSLNLPRVPTGVENTFTTIASTKYPQRSILNYNSGIQAGLGDLSRLPTEDRAIISALDDADNAPALSAVDSQAQVPGTFWNRFDGQVRTVTRLALIGGGLTLAGLTLSAIISQSNAINNGCFLAEKQGGRTNVKRILNYTCGQEGTTGDNIYLTNGNVAANHPAESVIPKPVCQMDEQNCQAYCNNTNYTYPEVYSALNSLPENLFVFCNRQTFGETIVDIGNQIGSGIGGVVGGTIGGLFSGFGGFFTIILIILLVVGGIILAVKLIPNKTNNASQPVSSSTIRT